MAQRERERILRDIVAHVADGGGSTGVVDLKGWIGRTYGMTYRMAENLLEDEYIRGWLRRYFGAIEITALGRELVPRIEEMGDDDRS